MPRTNREIKMRFSVSQSHCSYDLVIPKGTRVLSCKDSTGQYFVDSLAFIDQRKYPLLYHDAYFYGIRIDATDVDEETKKSEPKADFGALVKLAEESPGSLDCIIHDLLAAKASAINNEGQEAQVQTLITGGYSIDEIKDMLRGDEP